MTGVVGPTVKLTPLLGTPPTLTTTFPVVAPAGIVVVMRSVCQNVDTAGVLLNVTELDPCATPKFVPEIVTEVPTTPEFGDTAEIFGTGTGVTVNSRPLLAGPPTTSNTFPVFAELGTGATIEVALQLVGVAVVPLKVTVLVPCV